MQSLSNPANTLNTIRNLNTNVTAQNTSLERLSTGSRINKASAAGGASLDIDSLRLDLLGSTSEDNIETLNDFGSLIAATRGALGSFSRNVVDAQQSHIATATENLSLAKSLISDTDFGAESANLKQSQILVQSSMQLLAFMNSGSASVIDVFG